MSTDEAVIGFDSPPPRTKMPNSVSTPTIFGTATVRYRYWPVATRSIERQAEHQRAAQAAAEDALALSTRRYGAGLGTFLNVLTAETAVLAQRRLGVDLQARRITVDWQPDY